MTERRLTWRGKWVAPTTPGEAWRRFARHMLSMLALVGGLFGVVLLTAPGGASMTPRNEMDWLWIILAAAWVVPVIVGLEIRLLWKRLSSFRRGKVFLDDDEVAPEDAPPVSRRKRRETPAQARRRRKVWRELGLITVVWLFCTGLIGWVSFDYWMSGNPLGNMRTVLLGLLVVYPVLLVFMVQDKQDKDRGIWP